MDALDIGTRVGRYTLKALLATDAHCASWRAVTAGGRAVMVRVCQRRDREARERLLAEAATLRQVDHPGIVHVRDSGEDGTLCWLVVEHVEGTPLALWAASRRADEETATEILSCFAALADAVAALHDAHLLHTFLRPEAVRVRADGTPVIVDLGGACTEPVPDLEPDLRGDVRYRAPELTLGTEADRRVDIYALGAMLYEVFAGRPPYADAADIGLARCSVSVPPLEAVAPTTPPQAAWVVARAVQIEAADRPSSAHRIAELLRRRPGDPPTRKPGPPVAVPRFVGRAELVRQLTRQALAREGQTIVLHGPPGIGLSRILREVRGSMHVQGGQHVLLAGSESTLLQALETLAGPDVAPAVRHSLLGVDEAALVRWYPSLRPDEEWSTDPSGEDPLTESTAPEDGHGGGDPPVDDHSGSRHAAAARLLMRAASQRPLLVAVDDADRVPLDQLRTLAAAGLLLLGTHRPQKLRLQRISIEVPRLLPNEMAEIARSMISGAGPTLAWSHAADLAGLPGPLVALARSHDPTRPAPERSFESQGDPEVSWPDALEKAEHALAHSSPAEVLRCLSAPATPMPATGVLRHRLEIALARAHFQRGDDQSSLVHAALAAELAPTAVDRNRARLDAARSALRSGHFSACLDEARAGRAEAVTLEDPDLDARWATLQARTLDGLGRLWEARRVLRQLLSRSDLDPASRQGLRWTAAEVCVRLCRDTEAAALVKEAREALTARPAPRIAAGLWHVVGQMYLRTGQVTQARRAILDALATLEGLGDPELEARLRADLATVLTLAGDLEGARTNAASAVSLAETSGSRVALQSAVVSSMHSARHIGDPDTCIRLIAKVDELPAAWKGPREGALIRAEQALAALVTGQVHRARETLALGADIGLDDPYLAMMIRVRHAEMAWHLGSPPIDELVALTVDALRERLLHVAAVAQGLAIAAGAPPKDLDRAKADAEDRGDHFAAAWLRRAPAGGSDTSVPEDGFRFSTPLTELSGPVVPS